jgi:hypothetical protein
LAYSLIHRHVMTWCATSNIRYQTPWIQKLLQLFLSKTEGSWQLA